MNRLLLAGLVVTACLAAQPANAEIQFMAIIENEQEVSNPPIPEQGSGGIGFFILNDAQNALSYDVTLTGLDLDGLQTPNNPNDNVTRTHFHAAPAGQNGGIVFGQIDPNNDLDDRVINPVTGRITGVWDGTEGNGTTLAAQLANLLANNLYFNVHTSDHAGGEIRGQLVVIPEPGTWLLAILGCALGCLMWRRRRS
jgi:CHRD domain-containing protein/PEP-CTERM motif-containing protein